MLPARLANILWWAAYCTIALGLQRHFSGIDALIPGVLLSCQENKVRQTATLCILAVLIQDGTGSLAFGGALLWYASLLLFFALGRIFFVTDSLFFIVLLAIALGITHVIMLYVLSSLQGYLVSTQYLVKQAVAQALIIPPLYALASLARSRFFKHEHGI